jgi:signal transduction histidine kinase
MRSAQRVADVVKLLDSLGPEERARVAAVLNVPPLSVHLDQPPPVEDERGGTPQATMFYAVLRNALGDDRPARVTVGGAPAAWQPPRGPGFGGGPMGMGMGGGAHRAPPPGMSITTHVRLTDGTWATFDTHMTQAAATFPWRLLATLGILLAAVLLLSYVAVRWITRPIDALASAADELGRDIHRLPLPETGPTEVRRAANAFNTMQSRLVRLIDDRTRILAAMSHDLRTPITRMRLRAELMDDAESREKFEKDLAEMESMVTQALDFMRGVGAREPVQPIDVMALIHSLQAENREMGRMITVEGQVREPYLAAPSLLKRCIRNLVDNAVFYGGGADVVLEDARAQLAVHVRDRGPGIPDDQLENVFEPFVRLESSRSKETGGTGLGLGIARNIARLHGGDIRLRNMEGGGLEATLTLPRATDRC